MKKLKESPDRQYRISERFRGSIRITEYKPSEEDQQCREEITEACADIIRSIKNSL